MIWGGGITTVLMIVAVAWAMLMGVPDGFAFESIRENCLVAARRRRSENGDRNGQGRLAGFKGENALGGEVIRAGDGGAIDRRVLQR